MEKELKYYYSICEELYEAKSKFEEINKEWYASMAKKYPYMTFSDTGDYNFSMEANGEHWWFFTKPDKESMAIEMANSFESNNDRLSDLYYRFLVEGDFLPKGMEPIILKWTNSAPIRVTDGVNNLSPWLTGEIDEHDFFIHFTNPIAVKAEYGYLKDVISELTPNLLLKVYLEATTGESNHANLPEEVYQGFESLNRWLIDR